MNRGDKKDDNGRRVVVLTLAGGMPSGRVGVGSGLAVAESNGVPFSGELSSTSEKPPSAEERFPPDHSHLRLPGEDTNTHDSRFQRTAAP